MREGISDSGMSRWSTLEASRSPEKRGSPFDGEQRFRMRDRAVDNRGSAGIIHRHRHPDIEHITGHEAGRAHIESFFNEGKGIDAGGGSGNQIRAGLERAARRLVAL